MRKFLFLFALLFATSAFPQGLPFPGPGVTATQIALPISIGTRTISGVTSTCNITTTGNIVLGDLVVVVIQVASAPLRTVASVNDGTNAYAQAVAVNDASNFDNEIWYKANAAAVGSGGTITVTLSGATNNNGCAAESLRAPGLNTVPLDQIASQSATTANPSVTTGALAQSPELVIASTWQTAGTPTFTEAATFTTSTNALGVGNGNGRVSVSSKIAGSTSGVAYAPTWSASALNETVSATFKGP